MQTRKEKKEKNEHEHFVGDDPTKFPSEDMEKSLQ